jgi:hypothetical protein
MTNRPPKGVRIVCTDADIFVIVNGIKIAKRRPGWVPLSLVAVSDINSSCTAGYGIEVETCNGPHP